TGLQRVYYQTLHDEFGETLTVNPSDPHAGLANGSRIVDVPLLGFSLGVIACEDDMGFAVRVRTRPALPPPAPYSVPNIQRATGAKPSQPQTGVMQMRTTGTAMLPVCSVAAKGAFARAGEDQIIVAFRYLFCDGSNPNEELVVFISDQADTG